jgi:nucleoside-diphosphate-sugar epimerase
VTAREADAGLAALLVGARQGERRPLARFLTAIENGDDGVRDLLPALLAAGRCGERLPDTLRRLREDRSTGYYLVADQQHVTYAQLGRMMATAMGIRLYYNLYLIEPYPWFLAGLAEMISQLRNQPMEVSIDKLREATAPSWAVRVEKVRRELGFSPAAPLQQRMQETVDWYRANQWL